MGKKLFLNFLDYWSFNCNNYKITNHQFSNVLNIFLLFISGAGGAAGVGTVGQDVEGYRSQQYSFDSTALERAAKAAKDLEKSAHATEALALSRVQEETKQKEQEVNIKQYEAQIEQMKIEQKRVEGLWITVINTGKSFSEALIFVNP